MTKILFIIISLLVSMTANAIDIYGLSDKETQKIMRKYGKEFAALESAVQQEIKLHPPSSENADAPDSESFKALKKRKKDLVSKLTQEEGFLFIDFQVVFNPDENKLYTTVEIVDKQHPERLRFVSLNKKTDSTQPRKINKQDLIETMITYEDISSDLMLNHDLKLRPCPVFHCTFGFNHPKLKPYLEVFNKGATNKRQLILDTLNQDSDPKRRAAAAFLIGHFHDPHEIIAILSPHVSDKNDGVRNNVMEVIGATMAKAKISDINIMPFLNALDSPYESDRNKALYVLFNAMNSKASKDLMVQKGGDTLVALMRLTQPNNHDWAYQILKKISGKDFGETNVTAWSAWVASAKRQLT